MRTARLLTVSQHALLGGVPARGVPAQGRCTCWGGVPAGGVYLLGSVPAQGVYLLGVYLLEGVPAGRCTCPGGVPAQGCTGVKILPCPKLRLRVVIKHYIHLYHIVWASVFSTLDTESSCGIEIVSSMPLMFNGHELIITLWCFC